MMKMRWLLLMLLFAGVAHADLPGFSGDLTPPDWYGDENTTLQAWAFGTDANPASPDIDENAYGSPIAQIIRPDCRTRWMPEDHGHEGVWRLGGGGAMSLFVPNTDNTGPDTSKDIWVQILWSSFSIGYEPFLWVQTADNPPTYAHEIQTTLFDGPDAGAEVSELQCHRPRNYYHTSYKISLEPNPVEEWIFIKSSDCSSPVYIDEIIVDTRCIPEPATTALLSIGGLGVFGVRRFKKKGLAGMLDFPVFWRPFIFALSGSQTIAEPSRAGYLFWKWYFHKERAFFKALRKGRGLLLALLVPQIFVRCDCPDCNSKNIRRTHHPRRGKILRKLRFHRYVCKDCRRRFVSGV